MPTDIACNITKSSVLRLTASGAGSHGDLLLRSRAGDGFSSISKEFGKSVDWLLTGKEHAEQRKRAAKDAAGLG
jgi:hypothetical protein